MAELKRECWRRIDARSCAIFNPGGDCGPISQRVADQEIERSTNQMAEAKSEAKLVEQREMQSQNRAVGDARRQVVSVTKEAEQRKGVAVTEANRELEVSKLDLEAASKQTEAIRSRGQADAAVILFDARAKAEPLARTVKAFGDGVTYAQQFFLQKTAPSIRSILSNTDGPFAEIFKELQTTTPEALPGTSPGTAPVKKGGTP